MEQNYKNHIRFNPPFHFFAVPAVLVGIGFSIKAIVDNQDLTHALILLAFFMLIVVLGLTRVYSLKVQDRAIKNEETLRYYILTNRMLPSELTLGQILALRFASDDELTSLADRAVKEKLSSKEIKMAIKNWRGDYHRV